jgi:SAM-dependent methyltransferase
LDDHNVALIVEQRTVARRQRDFHEADRLKTLLEQQFNVVLVDHPMSEGGHTTWSVNDVPDTSTSIMHLARDFLDLVASGQHTEDELVATAVRVLQDEVAGRRNEMQGRKYADAAFDFALAGVANATLFHLLSAGATSELRRYGRRSSCRDVDILFVVEKMAAAGVTSHDSDCFAVAAELLRERAKERVSDGSDGGDADRAAVVDLLASGRFSLLSDRPLLWLWRQSARSRKFGNQMPAAAPSTEATVTLPVFDDPSLPLYVDVGCGLGTSLLGLATDPARPPANYLGADLSPGAVAFGRGIAARWGLTQRCGFVVCAAEDVLTALLDQYPGRVRGVHINFPTPYALNAVLGGSGDSGDSDGGDGDGTDDDDDDSGGGNRQLPQDLDDFMVTGPLVALCRRVLAAAGHTNDASPSSPPGYLLLQSNVEDVAVTTRRAVLRHGVGPEGRHSFVLPTDADVDALFGPGLTTCTEPPAPPASPIAPQAGGVTLQRRAQRWVDAGGERAAGAGWYSRRVLPPGARTETEAMCEMERKPVYRTVIVVK